MNSTGAGAPPAWPIFVGRGRSGTTLVRAMFDSHPGMAVPPESPFLVSLAHRRRSYEGPDGFRTDRFVHDLVNYRRFQLWGFSEPEIRAALADAAPRDYPGAVRAVYGLFARSQGKSRYADKSPLTTGSMLLLAPMFPEARFIHIVRDGRDVALSQLDVSFGSKDIVEAALDWRREVGHCRRAGLRIGPERYKEIHYEDLVADPERCLRDVCKFIDLRFDEAMLRYFERAERIVETTPTPVAHKGLFLPPTKGLRDWKRQMAPQDAVTFDILAGDVLDDLGYERAPGSASLNLRLGARCAQMSLELPRRARRLRNYLRPTRVLRHLGFGTGASK